MIYLEDIVCLVCGDDIHCDLMSIHQVHIKCHVLRCCPLTLFLSIEQEKVKSITTGNVWVLTHCRGTENKGKGKGVVLQSGTKSKLISRLRNYYITDLFLHVDYLHLQAQNWARFDINGPLSILHELVISLQCLSSVYLYLISLIALLILTTKLFTEPKHFNSTKKYTKISKEHMQYFVLTQLNVFLYH